MKRFMALWFRHLTTDWNTIKNRKLEGVPFVLAAPERGRKLVRAANLLAEGKGILPGMVLADAKALFPPLLVFDDDPLMAQKLLEKLSIWCLRYTPVAMVDPDDGLILDISGCAHLWDGERIYLTEIILKLRKHGYDVRGAIADTVGTAWAVSRYGKLTPVIETDGQKNALVNLPPAALRLDALITERMQKLGLDTVGSFMDLPRTVLRRRFGQELLDRLDQALGLAIEPILPITPIEPYQERLPCMEPIRTATGIEIALQNLLATLCQRLSKEGKGLRKCIFKGFRVDGETRQIEIGTNGPVRDSAHLFKLFEIKINTLEPDLGFELFMLEAPVVGELSVQQEALWNSGGVHDTMEIAKLLDRLAGRLGVDTIHRYLPDEHHWPERSIKQAVSSNEKPAIAWPGDQPRPVCLLQEPERIEVSAPIPDYPPMLFRYKGKVHKVKKADGPERVEREWWIEKGLQRDYYCVEDQEGARYWLFRSGHYEEHTPEWFLHGFFA